MEEFGFFSHIYEKLPPDFTAIFEIARVLEDETAQLSQKLREVVRLPAPAASKRLDKTEDFHRYTPAGDRYAAADRACGRAVDCAGRYRAVALDGVRAHY